MLNWFVYKRKPSSKECEMEEKHTKTDITSKEKPSLRPGQIVNLRDKNDQPVRFRTMGHGSISRVEKLQIENDMLREQLAKLQIDNTTSNHYLYANKPKIRSSPGQDFSLQQQSVQPPPTTTTTTDPSAPPLEQRTSFLDSLSQAYPSLTESVDASPEGEEDGVLVPLYPTISAPSSPTTITATNNANTTSTQMHVRPQDHPQDMEQANQILQGDTTGLMPGESKEVCVVDLHSKEWYTLSPDDYQVDNSTLHSKGEITVPSEDPSLGESYVLVQDGDLTDAIAEFVAQTMARHPEYKTMEPHQVKKFIEQAFVQVKEPTAWGKAYGWGQFLYTSYGWSTCAYSVYMEPAMAKFVFSSVMTGAKWCLVLLL